MKPIQFQGYQNITEKVVLKPFGLGRRLVEVTQLAPSSYERKNAIEDHEEVVYFNNLKSSKGFYGKCDGEDPDNSLREVGGFVLGHQALDFRIFPQTSFALFSKKGGLNLASSERGTLGCIQNEALGENFSELIKKNAITLVQEKLKQSKQGLESVFQLYAYTYISGDSDKYSGNIVYNADLNEVATFDNEESGIGFCCSSFRFPRCLAALIEGLPLQKEVLAKIGNFLANENKMRELLSSYFYPDETNNMFNAAQNLLQNTTVSFAEKHWNGRPWDPDR